MLFLEDDFAAADRYHLDLPPLSNYIDGRHPWELVFSSEDIDRLKDWTKHLRRRTEYYQLVRDQLIKDPGPGVYVYVFFGEDNEHIYVGMTRNPPLRFAHHRRRSWWPRVTSAFVSRIDCRWHDGPLCSLDQLDSIARRYEGSAIHHFEPTENRALGPVG